ncbi:MAG: hypothetical protein R6V17_08275, partial [Halanaerobacter sp.]
MKLSSSAGWEKEVNNKEEILRLVEEEVKKNPEQKLTLSQKAAGEVVDKVLYNGVDKETKDQWMKK